MQLELPDELADRLRQRTAQADGLSEVDVVRQALDTLDWLEEDQPTPEQLEASLAVIDQSMEELEAGQSMTVEEARMRTHRTLGLI